MLPSRSTIPAPYDQRMHSANFCRCARGPSPVHTTRNMWQPTWDTHFAFSPQGLALSPPTIVEVAQVARIEEEVGPKKVSKATFAWSERQRCVEVQTTCPVCLSTQIVTWTTHITQLDPLCSLYLLRPFWGTRRWHIITLHFLPSLCGPMLYIPNPRTLVGPPR